MAYTIRLNGKKMTYGAALTAIVLHLKKCDTLEMMQKEASKFSLLEDTNKLSVSVWRGDEDYEWAYLYVEGEEAKDIKHIGE